MSSVAVFTPKNRLKSILLNPDAPTVDALAAAANARVEVMRESLDEPLRDACAHILSLAKPSQLETSAVRETLAGYARTICAIAAPAGRAALGEVARGLIEVIEARIEPVERRTQTLRIHIDALALLHVESAGGGAVADDVLRHLKQLRDRVGVS